MSLPVAEFTPTPIVIVTYGHQHQMSKHIESRIMNGFAQSKAYWLDLRSELKDPLHENQVQYQHDAAHDETINAVFAQEQFPRLLVDTLEEVVKTELNIVIAKCNTGHHRADTFGKGVPGCTVGDHEKRLAAVRRLARAYAQADQEAAHR